MRRIFPRCLTQVKAAQPDAVFLASHETEALNFIRQAKGLDVNPKMLFSFTVGVPTADFRKALGTDAEYAFGMSSWLPDAKPQGRLVRRRGSVRQAVQGEIRLRAGLPRRVRPSPTSRPS